MHKKYFITLTLIPTFFTIGVAKAQCPVCTAAVIGGVGMARWLKIDDTITGLWVGGLLVSTSIWTINWLKSKKWDFVGQDYIIPLAYYAMTIIPLYYYNIVGHPLNVFWGLDKLILGTIFGSLFFWAAILKYAEIKKRNNGHAQFPFQRVAIPVGTLLVLSTIFYFLTRF
jgi:hypothetical protein